MKASAFFYVEFGKLVLPYHVPVIAYNLVNGILDELAMLLAALLEGYWSHYRKMGKLVFDVCLIFIFIVWGIVKTIA